MSMLSQVNVVKLFVALIFMVPILRLNAQQKLEIDEQADKMFSIEQITSKQKNQAPIPMNKRCLCNQTLLKNGDFTTGPATGGDIPNTSNVLAWSKGTNTPQYYPAMGYSTPGFIYMWGNKVVSESIKQKVYFQKGKKYRGCFAFKYVYSMPENPSKHIRFKLLASKTDQLNTPQCPNNSCNTITISQTVVESNGWQVHTFENWIPNDDYYFLYVVPENDQTKISSQHISHGAIDDICIEEARVLPCEDLFPFTNFTLKNSSTNGNIVTNLEFEPLNAAPYGTSHWWQIYEAANGNNDDFTVLNEFSGDSPLRAVSADANFVVSSPQQNFANIEINKYYVIKHGMYYNAGTPGCKWVERRAKIRISFSSNQKRSVEFRHQTSTPCARKLVVNVSDLKNELNSIENCKPPLACTQNSTFKEFEVKTFSNVFTSTSHSNNGSGFDIQYQNNLLEQVKTLALAQAPACTNATKKIVYKIVFRYEFINPVYKIHADVTYACCTGVRPN